MDYIQTRLLSSKMADGVHNFRNMCFLSAAELLTDQLMARTIYIY